MPDSWKLVALVLCILMLGAAFIVGYPSVWAICILALAVVCIAIDKRMSKNHT